MTDFLKQANDWAALVERAAQARPTSLLARVVGKLIAENPLLKRGMGPNSEQMLQQQQTHIRERLDCDAKESKGAFKLIMFGVAILAGFSAAAFPLGTVILTSSLISLIAVCQGFARCINLLEHHHACQYFFGKEPVPESDLIWLKNLTRQAPNSPVRQEFCRDVRHAATLAVACAALSVGAGAVRYGAEHSKQAKPAPVVTGALENSRTSR